MNILNTEESTSDIELDNSFQLGQQQLAPTLEDEFERPAIEAEAKYQKDLLEWREKSSQDTDKNLLEFESYRPDEEEPVKKQRLIRSVLNAEHDLSPKNHTNYEMARAQVSSQMFGEELDDDQFFIKLQERAQGRKEVRDLDLSMVQSAFLSSMAPEDVNFDDWGAENIKGIITGEENAKNLARWNEHQDKIEEQYGDILPSIRGTYSAMTRGGDWIAYAKSQITGLDDEEKDKYLYGLRAALGNNPKPEIANKFKRLGINILKSRRGVKSAIGNAGTFAGNEVREGGSYGFARLFGSNEAAAEERARSKDDELTAKHLREDQNFINELRSVFENEYDPIQLLAEEGGAAAAIESGVYQIPGALTTTAIAAIPVAGPALTYGSLAESSRQTYMAAILEEGRVNGNPTSRAEADVMASQMGKVAAVPSMLLERFQATALTKNTGISKAVGKLDGLIKNSLARGATKFVVASTAETGVELTQEISDSLVQAAAASFSEEVPDVVWSNGEDGVFDDYFNKFLTTFTAVSPLGVISAHRSVGLEVKAQTFKEASPLVRQSFGITKEDSDKIDAAENPSELLEAYQAAIENKDGKSENAIASTKELASQLENKAEAELEMVEKGRLLGARTTQGSELMEVYNSQTGEVVAEGLDRSQTAGFIMNHFNIKEREKMQLHDEMVTQMEGAQLLQEDSDSVTEFRPFANMTVAQAAVEFEGSEERLAAEAADSERLDGGDGAIAKSVFGAHVPAGVAGRAENTNVLFGNSTLFTAIHEHTHEVRRRWMRDGTFTFIEQVDAISSIDDAFRELSLSRQENGETVTVRGADRTYLPDDFHDKSPQEQETLVDEAISQIAETFSLRTRNGEKTKFRELLNRNLAARVRKGDKGAIKIKAFVSSMRDWFGLNLERSQLMKKAEREGSLDSAQLDELQAKIFGETAQGNHDAGVQEAYEGILDDNVPFSVGSVTPEQDAQYLKLAQDPEGNKEDLKDIIDETARKYGYNFSHRRKNEEDPRETGHVILFAEDRFSNENYGEYDYALKESLAVDVKPWMTSWYAEHLRGTNSYYEGMEFDEILEKAEELMNPIDIVDTAAFWDDSEAVSAFWNENEDRLLDEGLVAVKTPDGAVLFDPYSKKSAIKSTSGVTFDDKGELIPLSQRFNESSDDIRFSVGSARMADSIITDVSKRVKNPEAKVRVLGSVIERVAAQKREVDEMSVAFGKAVVKKAEVDPRTKKSLQKEAAFRQADLTEQYVNQVHEESGFILEQEELTKLKEQPIHEYLSNPNDPLHGQLTSKSQAIKQGKMSVKDGDFDGASNVSRTIFGGTLMPDQAAQELYESGLIREPDIDLMWEALEKEYVSVTSRKEDFKNGKSKLQDAKKRARDESREWLDERLSEQERDHNPRTAMLRSLAMYDAILMALPIELRGKMGGYVQLAKLKTDEARLKFLLERMDKLEGVVDKWVSNQADQDLKKFFKRAAAKRQKSGKTDKGKFDGESHKIFTAIKDATKMSMEEVDKQVAAAESVVSQGTEVDSDTWVRNLMLTNLLPQFGDWKNQSAEGKTEALKAGWNVYERALLDAKIRDAEQRERYEAGREAFKSATGVTAKGEALQKKLQEQRNFDKTKSAKKAVKDLDLNLAGFSGLLERLFGTNELTEQLVERQRKSEMLQSQMRREAGDTVNNYFRELAGGELAGMHMVADLMKPTIETASGTYSEMQALTATMMWMQEDGRKHMEGTKDEDGKVTSSWSYDQEFIDSIESKLSDEAKGFRSLLLQKYEEGYAPLNDVHKRVHYIDMPKVSNYSPLTVKPFMEAMDKGIDPFTMAGSGNASSAGFTKRRSATAVSEPSFEDAFTVFLSHTDQSAHFVAFAELSKDMNAILGQREVMTNVEVKAGQQGRVSLKSWLDFYNEGGARSAGARLGINKFLHDTFGNLAKMALALRPSVTFIQTTILGGGMVDMPMRQYMKGMAKLASGQLDIKSAWKSEFIQQRFIDKPVILQALQSGDPSQAPNKMQYWVDKIAHYGISGADALLTSATYEIYRDHYTNEAKLMELEGEAAAKYVDLKTVRSTERVSQPTRTGTRSIMENTERSPFKIMGMAFASDSRMKSSLLAQTLTKGTKAEKSRALIFYFIVNGFAAAVIRNVWRDARSDEDDEIFDAENWDMKAMMVATMFGPINGVPILGDQVSNAANDFFGERNFYGNLSDNIGKGAKPITKIDDYVNGDVDADRALRDMETIMTTVGAFNDKATPAKSIISLLRDLNKLKENAISE